LKYRQVEVLRISLIGVILSNLLLMTGLAFVVGGYSMKGQFFSVSVAQLLGSLLLLALMSLMVPTASDILSHVSPNGILQQSRGTAIMLLLSYVLWLIFQLKTHPRFFDQPSPKGSAKRKPGLEKGSTTRGMAQIGAAAAGTSGGKISELEEIVEDPQLSLWTAIGSLIIATVLIAFNTQFATNSINGLLDGAGLSPTFVGLVILPLLSNDPTTLKVAHQDKMDLALALTIGKCIQTALMVIPLVIVVAWGMGVDEMTLSFKGFEIVSLFASVLIVNYIVQDGTSNWYVYFDFTS